MSKIDYQTLRERYSPKPVPECSVCGEEMSIQRISGAHVVYACSSYGGDGDFKIGRTLADEHYEKSRVTVVDDSDPDPDVIALLDELEAAKSKLNEQREYYEGVIADGSKRIAELEAEPVSQTCKLNDPSGNSPVTPDGLSTVCAEAYQVVGVMADALGVFGDAAVQKVLDNLSQQKLVHRDVLPFSLPVTPDGWISCSERMPAQDDWILIYSKHGEYMAGQVQGEYVELSDGTLSWLGNALFWMQLPEPPQEVK